MFSGRVLILACSLVVFAAVVQAQFDANFIQGRRQVPLNLRPEPLNLQPEPLNLRPASFSRRPASFARSSASISVYEEPNYDGQSFLIPIQRCVDLNRFEDRVSSVDTHSGCVRLYSERACSGRSIAFYPGSRGQEDLLDLDFDKTARSVGVC